MKSAYLCLILLLVITCFSYAAVIRVPSDQPTIQAGIDAAVNGDTVLVADGTWTGFGNKNLDFKGKAITVKSENGAENCIIEGRGFIFQSGEGEYSVLSGFAIQNGYSDYGGGIYCGNSSSPTITNCTITNCITTGEFLDGFGGGIYCGGSPTITNCTITGNYAGDGGGIYCGGSPTFTNCTITGNSAFYAGGGIFCFGRSSSLTITNCTISSNSALHAAGGGICCDGSLLTITNCTIIGNSTIYAGGGIYCDYPSTITNCILWDDSPDEIDGSNPVVTYSDIQGGWPGEGNIDTDPLFIDPDNGNYYLQVGSPCLSMANCEEAPKIDKDGRPRPLGSGCDMGAYEQFDDGSVPVKMTALTATTTTDDVTLKWRTATETNNLGFNIYRSDTKDGKYIKLNTILLSGAGTDATPHDYLFTDENIVDTRTYYYYIECVDFNGKRDKSPILQITVGQDSEVKVIDNSKIIVPSKLKTVIIPTEFALLQNFPNPFNPDTWLPFKLAKNASVTISIYDTKGQLIRTIALGNRNAGIYTTKDKAACWNGRDNLGEKVSSGVYYYTLQAGEFKAMKKMVIMK